MMMMMLMTTVMTSMIIVMIMNNLGHQHTKSYEKNGWFITNPQFSFHGKMDNFVALDPA